MAFPICRYFRTVFVQMFRSTEQGQVGRVIIQGISVFMMYDFPSRDRAEVFQPYNAGEFRPAIVALSEFDETPQVPGLVLADGHGSKGNEFTVWLSLFEFGGWRDVDALQSLVPGKLSFSECSSIGMLPGSITITDQSLCIGFAQTRPRAISGSLGSIGCHFKGLSTVITSQRNSFPFHGNHYTASGTTSQAPELGRRAVGFDLSHLYLRRDSRHRLAGVTMGFAI